MLKNNNFKLIKKENLCCGNTNNTLNKEVSLDYINIKNKVNCTIIGDILNDNNTELLVLIYNQEFDKNIKNKLLLLIKAKNYSCLKYINNKNIKIILSKLEDNQIKDIYNYYMNNNLQSYKSFIIIEKKVKGISNHNILSFFKYYYVYNGLNITFNYDINLELLQLINYFKKYINSSTTLSELLVSKILFYFNELSINNMKLNKKIFKIFYLIIKFKKENNNNCLFFNSLYNEIIKKIEIKNLNIILNIGIHKDLIKNNSNNNFWIIFIDELVVLLKDDYSFSEIFNILYALRRSIYSDIFDYNLKLEDIVLFKLQSNITIFEHNIYSNNGINYYAMESNKIKNYNCLINDNTIIKDNRKINNLLFFEAINIKIMNNNLIIISKFQYMFLDRLVENESNYDTLLEEVIKDPELKNINTEFVIEDINFLFNCKYKLLVKDNSNIVRLNNELLLTDKLLIYNISSNIALLTKIFSNNIHNSTDNSNIGNQDLLYNLQSLIIKKLKIEKEITNNLLISYVNNALGTNINNEIFNKTLDALSQKKYITIHNNKIIYNP